ncbi:MAG: hypothetical protein WC364_12330 [Eubacteriales bacterium]|jgi:hypothetical protein
MVEKFEKTFLSDELDEEIAVIRGEIWDNCRDWCYKCSIAIPENEKERKIVLCPKCKRILGFIPKNGINEYLKTLQPDEREAREKGIWHHLSGLVYKELDREKHLYEDFPIPKDWMKIEGVDPHDARGTCWLFGAVSPEEIEIQGKVRHRIFVHDYLFTHDSIADIVRQVKSIRAMHNYTDPAFVILDAKYGIKSGLGSTEEEKKSWQSELEREGIRHIKMSHSSPGDVELGHKIVREYLKDNYSKVTQAARPGLMFAKKSCSGFNSPIQYMFNYQYDDKTHKPKEEYKDWADCVRYFCLEQPIYRSPANEQNIIDLLQVRMNKAINLRRSAVNG